METFGNETLADHFYEQLTGPSSRNHHSTSKEKRVGLTKEKSPAEGKTKIECRGNFPARRAQPNNYATNELSFGLFAVNRLNTETELRVALPNRKSTLRSKTENDY